MKTADELKREGYVVGGVLRRWKQGSDDEYAVSSRRFDEAVMSHRERGADVVVTTHALGKDWWVKETPNA